VNDQMGHSSIQVTVDLYGHPIPGGNKQAVDRLDTPVLLLNSATPAQPAAMFAGPVSSNQLMPQEVMTRGYGVDDEFPTRATRSTGRGGTPVGELTAAAESPLRNEEPRPSRRGLLTIQAALDPSPARLGAGHSAESWPR
jgi:hypothetical protein